MKKIRSIAATALLASTMMVAPASAQTTGDNRGNVGCTQDQRGGGGGAGDILPGARSQENRQAVIAGLIAAAVSNVGVEAAVLNGVLNNANVQVVCLDNVLNQNDIALVEDVLNRSPILSGNRDVLSGNDVLTNFLNENNIVADVEVISVDLGSGEIFVLRS